MSEARPAGSEKDSLRPFGTTPPRPAGILYLWATLFVLCFLGLVILALRDQLT